MVDIVTPIDHQEKGAALMLSQFKDSENLIELLKTWLSTLSDLEGCLLDWSKANGVDTAVGDFLDIIGSWMGVDRGLRSDEEYRQAILAAGVLEGMDGTTEKFLEGMRVISQSNSVTFHQLYPATVYAHLGDGWNNYTYQQLERIVPAGTHLRVLLDNNLDSMTASEILERDNGLVTGDQDQYVVDIDGVKYDLITSESSGETVDSTGNYLAEQFDTEWTPMAEMVTYTRQGVQGLIVDNEGNYILDENNNRINYRGFVQ